MGEENMTKGLKQRVEALLFATQGLTVDKLCESLGANENAVMDALIALKSDYDARQSAFVIVDKGGLWELTVKSEHVPVVKDLIPSEFPKSILETLAVIAWKAPAIQSEVIKVRGNKAYKHISFLENYGLIATKKSGRTNELQLTDKFYDYFNSDQREIKNKLNPN